jgi:Flp pilus assembly protein TadG
LITGQHSFLSAYKKHELMTAIRPDKRPTKPFGRKRHRESGSATTEFAIVSLPLMALIFLLMDTAWMIFARAAILEGVREGVRYGITGQPPGCVGSSLNACIQQTVEKFSFGFVNPKNVSTVVQINYYLASNLTAVTGSNASMGGNVLKVTVLGLPLVPLAPLWRQVSAVSLSASSSDVMESGTTNLSP